jgi:hypothetical protein
MPYYARTRTDGPGLGPNKPTYPDDTPRNVSILWSYPDEFVAAFNKLSKYDQSTWGSQAYRKQYGASDLFQIEVHGVRFNAWIYLNYYNRKFIQHESVDFSGALAPPEGLFPMVERPVEYSSRTMSDNPTPDFIRRKARGDIIMTDMTSTSEEWSKSFSISPAAYTCTAAYFDENHTLEPPAGSMFYSAIDLAAMDALAVSSGGHLSVDPAYVSGLAANAALANQSAADFESLVALVEGPETVKYIADKLAKLVQLIRKAKDPKQWKRIKSRSGDKIDSFQSAWLEMRYAIRPLMYDVESAIKALNATKKPPRQTYRGTENQITTDSNVEVVGDYTVTTVKATEIVARACLITEISQNAQSSQTWGLFNVGSAVVELIPYSFVVGWFLNLDGIISSMNPSPHQLPLGGCVTATTTTSTSVHVVHNPSGSFCTYTSTLTDRVRTPDVQPMYLTLDINLDIPKLIDLAALTRQLLK